MEDRKEYYRNYNKEYRRKNHGKIMDLGRSWRKRSRNELAGRTDEEKRLAEIAAALDREWQWAETTEERKKTLRETHHAAIDAVIRLFYERGALKIREGGLNE